MLVARYIKKKSMEAAMRFTTVLVTYTIKSCSSRITLHLEQLGTKRYMIHHRSVSTCGIHRNWKASIVIPIPNPAKTICHGTLLTLMSLCTQLPRYWRRSICQELTLYRLITGVLDLSQGTGKTLKATHTADVIKSENITILF